MQRTKVKICGIRSLESAQAALDAGADFLGLNFAIGYSRYIEPRAALKIISALPRNSKTKFVGVFLNEDHRIVNAICAMLGLEYVQLHGDETAEYCRRIGAKIIKTVSIHGPLDPSALMQQMRRYVVDYFLLDIVKGTDGTIRDYVVEARTIAQEVPLFLSGRLDITTVSEAIEGARPFAVDVARGVETKGREDAQKIKAFIRHVHSGEYRKKLILTN